MRTARYAKRADGPHKATRLRYVSAENNYGRSFLAEVTHKGGQAAERAVRLERKQYGHHKLNEVLGRCAAAEPPLHRGAVSSATALMALGTLSTKSP